LIDLSTRICKATFPNPVFTASGTFGYGLDIPEWVDLHHLGAVITKSITLHPREGNPPPRAVETPSGMLNSIGLANVGVEEFVKKMLPQYETFPCPVIVNIAGSTQEEYEQVLKKVEAVSSSIVGYEVNISCPNVKAGGMEFGVQAELTAQLTARLRALTDRLIIIKLSPNVTDITSIGKAAEENGADALSAINTVVGMAIDPNTKESQIYTTYGGLSGPAIKPIGVACVHKLTQAVAIPIIGVGGICTVRDIVEYLLAGASAIQVGTAHFRDPGISVELVENLEQYCKDQNLACLQDLIGKVKTFS